MHIEEFNPTVAQLQKLVSESKEIEVVDFDNKEDMEMVKSYRISLRDARVAVTKKGKELREDALKFQKSIIEREKELIAIIEPEENRLKSIEEESKLIKEKADRLAMLPIRKEKLDAIKDGVEISNDELLEMDSNTFQEYVNKRNSDKIIKAEQILIDRENKLKEAEDRLKREDELSKAKEEAKKQEREKIAQEQKYEQDRIEQQKKEYELKAKEETEKIQKRKDYAKFLLSHGYTKETADSFKIEEVIEGYVIYKKLGIFKK